MLSPSAKVRRGLISLGVVWHGMGRKRQRRPTPDGVGRFLQGQKMKITLMQHARAEVQRLESAWRGGPGVTLVQSVEDLPFPAPSDARGAFLPGSGKVFIVANTQKSDQIAGTMAHEILGHHGLRADLGRSWKEFMFGIQSGLRSGDGQLQRFRDGVRSVYVDNNGVFNLSAVQESDEIAAAVVEARFRGDTGRMHVNRPLRKRISAAMGHFYREALYADKPVSLHQLEGAILAAEHRLRHGDGFFGIGCRLRRWYASQMSKPWNPLDRPMSLAESQELLRADAASKHDRSEWIFLFQCIGFFLALIGLVLAYGAVIWGFISNLGLLFR